MGMNIKVPEVHAMARELAARRSTTVTELCSTRPSARGQEGGDPRDLCPFQCPI